MPFSYWRTTYVAVKYLKQYLNKMNKNIMEPYNDLYYHIYQVSMKPVEPVVFDAWLGAVLRSNLRKLLMAQKDKYSLLDSNFPKGYLFSGFSHTQMNTDPVSVDKNEKVSFNLLLVGKLNDYFEIFREAIEDMCEEGFGKTSLTGCPCKVRFRAVRFSPAVRVGLSDFDSSLLQPKQKIHLTVHCTTPVSLIRMEEKTAPELSYQDKCNCFPSLYQLVQSARYRLHHLKNIYINNNLDLISSFEDDFHTEAANARLESANLYFVRLQNTQKKEHINRQPLEGYIGEMCYSGRLQQYLPMLQFVSGLGVGKDTVWGLGQIKVEIRN